MPRARPPSSPSSLAAAAAVTTASTSTSTSTSTILNHTYAPFYACYLLKSYNPKRLNQTYIGSTPDPPRRWRQHMGETVGGAFKTRLARPWEMEAIVYGFPTKLQALQFEWAWQNPHASRLLHAVPVATPETEATEHGSESELATTTPTTKGRKKAGSKPKTDKRKQAAPKPVAQFPRTAASNRGQTRIQVLQYMLTVPPWRSFNLRVMLFSDLARTWWDRAKLAGPTVRTDAGWNKFEKLLEKEKGKGRETDDDLRVRDAWGERATWLERVQVDLRREGVDGERLVRIGEKQEQDAIGRMRIDDDDFFHAQWSKWTELVSSRDCHLCSQQVDHADHLSFFLCTSASSHASTSDAGTNPCTALFHPSCLSAHFLSSTLSGPNRRPPLSAAAAIGTAAPPAVLAPPLLPTHGNCPACDAELHWTDLVRSSYRRMEEVEGKRKKRTRQRAKAGGALGSEAALADVDQDDGDDDDTEGVSLPPPSPTKRKKRATTAVKSTPATKGRRKPTKKSSTKSRPTESADEVIQLGESFNFSSDLGPEDDDDDDDDVVDRTRAREGLDVDFSDGDEATDDEPGDEERSFARLEAAQDALDFARDELLRDDFEDGDDDVRTDLEEDDDDDDSDILPVSLLAKTISSQAPTKKTISARRGGSSRGIAKLSDSFASTKPAQSRTGGAKKRSTSSSLPSDDSDGLSPLALPTGKSGQTAGKGTAAASSSGGGKPRSKKAPPAYIEISD